MNKQVWQVELQIIERSYSGGTSVVRGIASDCTEAVQLAVKKENQGSKHRQVTVTSVKYLGELSF